MNEPPIPHDDGSKFMRWCRTMHLRVYRRLRLIAGPGIRIQDTSDGQIISALATQKNISGTGGVNYRNTYSDLENYQKFDIVRVMDGASQGVWISVSDTPLQGVRPVWPEPATLTPPQVNKWELFTLGVQITSACKNGDKVVYTHASPPMDLPT